MAQVSNKGSADAAADPKQWSQSQLSLWKPRTRAVPWRAPPMPPPMPTPWRPWRLNPAVDPLMMTLRKVNVDVANWKDPSVLMESYHE